MSTEREVLIDTIKELYARDKDIIFAYVSNDDYYSYATIGLKNGLILYMEYHKYTGYKISINYVPNRAAGSGYNDGSVYYNVEDINFTDISNKLYLGVLALRRRNTTPINMYKNEAHWFNHDPYHKTCYVKLELN